MTHQSYTFIKFAGVGLISKNNKIHYIGDIQRLTSQCLKKQLATEYYKNQETYPWFQEEVKSGSCNSAYKQQPCRESPLF